MPAPVLALPQPKDPSGVFLFPDDVISEITNEEEKHGIYTAERCPPTKKEAIVQLLKECRPIAWIAKVLQVHKATVIAIADSHASEIDEGRRTTIAPKARRVIHQQLDRLEMYPDALPAQSIALAIKMLYDVQALEDGKPTSRTEHTERVDIFGAFLAMTTELKKEMEPEKEVPETGLGGRKESVIDAASARVDVIENREADCMLSPRTDPESERSDTDAQVNPSHVTAFDTDRGPESAADPEQVQASGHPRGGDGPGQRPAGHSTDNDARNFAANRS